MDIISRAAWGARPPRSITTTPWSTRTGFVTHYSARPPDQSVRAIQDFHMDTNGWSDIGYNFLTDVAGRIYMGRGWAAIGAHVQNHNTANIGVCMIGRDGDVSDAAKTSIRWLYDEACRLAGRTLAQRYHSQLYPTQCPGATLRAWVIAGMPTPQAAQPSTMEDRMLHGQIPTGQTPIIVCTPWEKSSISFGCDFGQARLRVAEHEVNVGWHVREVTIGSGDAHRLDLPARVNIDRRCIMRLPADAGDEMIVPVGYLAWW